MSDPTSRYDFAILKFIKRPLVKCTDPDDLSQLRPEDSDALRSIAKLFGKHPDIVWFDIVDAAQEQRRAEIADEEDRPGPGSP